MIDPIVWRYVSVQAGYTPLHSACHFGQINMIRFLLENGASVNSSTKVIAMANMDKMDGWMDEDDDDIFIVLVHAQNLRRPIRQIITVAADIQPNCLRRR